MKMIREAILNKLKEKSISQRKCALDNDITYQNFNQFLKGNRALPLPDIEKVFRYLNIRLE